MNRYTIYCTEEQARNAIKLGAPLKELIYSKDFENAEHAIVEEIYYTLRHYEVPTAEQMIGWLREKDLYINIIHVSAGYTSWVKTIKENITLSEGNTGFVNSFEEATLAAIDAALGYLTTGNKK